MGYRIRPTDFDGLFDQDPYAKVIISDENSLLVRDQANEYFKTLFLNTADAQKNFSPKCECGELHTKYYEGSVCAICGVKCEQDFSKIKFKGWFSIPDKLPPMLNPTCYKKLEKYLLNFEKVSILKLLLDKDIDIPNSPEFFNVLGRGMFYFHDNFDSIMDFFMHQYKPFQRNIKKPSTKLMEKFIKENRDVMFVRHLPILNSSLHLITKQGAIKRTDSCSPLIFEVLVEMATLIHAMEHSPRSPKFFDSQYFNILNKYNEYAQMCVRKKLLRKEGMFRKNILGCKMHNSARAVIIPLDPEEDIDIIHIPWRMGIRLYRLEVMNILVNRKGMVFTDAIAKISRAESNYDSDIAAIFKTLIIESKYKALVILAGRNPQLN